MITLSEQLEEENNIFTLEKAIKKELNDESLQVSKVQLKNFITEVKKFGISDLNTSINGKKFIIHLDQNKQYKVYSEQSPEKIKENFKLLAKNKEEEKEFLNDIKGGIKFYTIDKQNLMFHPGINRLINVGLTETKLKEKQEPLINKFFKFLLSKITKRPVKKHYEIDYDSKREDFLKELKGETSLPSEKKDVAYTQENKHLLNKLIKQNPNFILEVTNPPIVTSIRNFSNLKKEEKKLFLEKNPKQEKIINFFKEYKLDENMTSSMIKSLLEGKKSNILTIDLEGKKLKGKMDLYQTPSGEIKTTFYKQKELPIENTILFKKIKSPKKKEHLMSGGILPMKDIEGSMKYFKYDKELNDILEVKLSDLNIPSKIFLEKTPNQIIDLFMGKPLEINLEINGMSIPNVLVKIDKGVINLDGAEKGLIKEKSVNLEVLKTREEIVNEIASNKTLSLDEKMKLATEKKVGLKEVLESINRTNKAPKKIGIVSKNTQAEVKTSLKETFEKSNTLNEYLEKIGREKQVSVWVAFDKENSTISGISYKKSNEIILGKDSSVGLKEIIEKFGKESIKQENINKSYLINEIEDNKEVPKKKGQSI